MKSFQEFISMMYPNTDPEIERIQILNLIKQNKEFLMFFLPQMNEEWVTEYLYHLIDNEIELLKSVVDV